MKERYFITGGSGFVGANVVRALVAKGAHVALLVRNKKLNPRLSDLSDKITTYKGDITDVNFVSVFSKEKPSILFHFAAYGATPAEMDFHQMVKTNILGLQRMLCAAQNTTVRLFVHTGSSSEYGLKTKAMTETDVAQPVNDYGVTKAAATLYCQMMSDRSTFSTTIFRLFSPYGYFDTSTRFIPSVINAARTGKSLNASQKTFIRDYIFIEDVVRAYNLAVTKNSRTLNGQIINIGSGIQYRLSDVVKCVEKISKRKIDIHWNTKPKQDRQVEPNIWVANNRKAKALLGWEPRVSLVSGLEKTLAWSNSQHQKK